MQEKKTHLERMIEKHGSYENYRKFMQSIAPKGGSKVTEKTKNKGFGSNPELAAEQGFKRKKGK